MGVVMKTLSNKLALVSSRLLLSVCNSPKTIQPTIWLPRGRPALACRDNALDRVTITARSIMPNCRFY